MTEKVILESTQLTAANIIGTDIYTNSCRKMPTTTIDHGRSGEGW